MLEVLESLLCFDAWLNQSHYWETSNPTHVARIMAKHQDSIRNFMDICKKSIPLKMEGKDEEEKMVRKSDQVKRMDLMREPQRSKKGNNEKHGTSNPIKIEGQNNNNHADVWKFPKFHELLYIVRVDDMSRFESPVNFCAQRPESLLIPAAKHPGRQAQKRIEGSAYELQAAQRLM